MASHDHPHENPKAIAALGELILRHSTAGLTPAHATEAARVVLSLFDLAGKGTLVSFKQWVLQMEAAGPYASVDGTDTQAQNCAAEICC